MIEQDNMQTRRTLLQRIGDVENAHAWYEFVYYYRGYIYSILRKMQVSHHDAEEIVQQVLLKVSDIIKTFTYDPARGSFRGYLARITANTAKNHFRSLRHDVSLSEMDDHDEILQGATGESELDKLAEEEWTRHLYRIAWRNVSTGFGEKVRQTWEMLYEGKGVETIATALELTESTIYVYKKRVQEKLEHELKRLKVELG